MLGNIIANVVGDVIKTALTSEDQKQVAIQQSKDQRNVAIAQTVVQGAVAAYGIYSQTQQIATQAMPANQTMQPVPVAEEVPLLATNSQPTYNINYNTVWANKNKGEMGATLTEVNTGENINIVYRMQNIGNKKYKVFLRVNDEEWEDEGVIDWNRMNVADLANAIDPFFSEIVSIVMHK